MDEVILVVGRNRLLSAAGVQGFVPGGVDEYVERIRRHGDFRRRGDVEDDPSFKQIIPYLIVRHGDRIFLYQRSRQGGEARLHGLYSIGVGGHITWEDVAGADDVLAAGLTRELDEELIVESPWRARPVGVLNEDENRVSQVHFGVVYVVELDEPRVQVREADRLSGYLALRADVRAARSHMETWSQLILDAADPFAL